MRFLTAVILTILLGSPALALDNLVVQNSGKVVVNGEFETDNYTIKLGKDWYLNYNSGLMEEIDLRIKLPSETIIKQIESNVEYSITYNNGIMLSFQSFNTSAYVKLKYSFAASEKTDYLLLLLLPILLSPPIIIFVYHYKFRKEKDKILNMLSERERQVYLTLKQLGRKSKQSKIRRVTGLPKSTLSRTIKKLEEKNLIVKEGEGSMSKIILK